MVNGLLALSRAKKRLLFVAFDALLLTFCLWAAFALRLSSLGSEFLPRFWWLFAVVPVAAVPLFARMGINRPVLRYFGGRSFHVVVRAVTLHVLILGALMAIVGFEGFPRSVLGIYWLLGVVAIGGSRYVGRSFLQDYLKSLRSPKRILIFGAGKPGAELAQALNEGWSFKPIGFVDDKRALQGSHVQGLEVHPTSGLDELVQKLSVDELLLAIPAASRSRRREVLERLESLPILIKTVPSIDDLMRGRAAVADVRDLDLEDLLDLLGRKPVAPSDELMTKAVRGKSVMVTGAGGSIGSELCRQIRRMKPARLVLFELSEPALYQIHRELASTAKDSVDATTPDVELIPILGNVTDGNNLYSVIKALGVQTIYHAAAYKHVPLVEHNPVAGVKNNVFGTLSAAKAARRAAVETFILISTDKAVRPTNVMGASKRMAELILQGLATQPGTTRFSMVRFGNVLGSSGSVVPLFREQIERGGPITVTDPAVVRFFMTIPEAAELVIQAGAMSEGGDVFVLDMGKSMKVIDVARRMVRLRGLRIRDNEHPDGDIAIEFTGLRAGEKLYEELVLGNDISATEHPRIMRAQESALPWHQLEAILERIEDACRQFDSARIRVLLLEAVTDYRPQGEIPDLWRNVATSTATAAIQ